MKSLKFGLLAFFISMNFVYLNATKEGSAATVVTKNFDFQDPENPDLIENIADENDIEWLEGALAHFHNNPGGADIEFEDEELTDVSSDEGIPNYFSESDSDEELQEEMDTTTLELANAENITAAVISVEPLPTLPIYILRNLLNSSFASFDTCCEYLKTVAEEDVYAHESELVELFAKKIKAELEKSELAGDAIDFTYFIHNTCILPFTKNQRDSFLIKMSLVFLFKDIDHTAQTNLFYKKAFAQVLYHAGFVPNYAPFKSFIKSYIDALKHYDPENKLTSVDPLVEECDPYIIAANNNSYNFLRVLNNLGIPQVATPHLSIKRESFEEESGRLKKRFKSE